MTTVNNKADTMSRTKATQATVNKDQEAVKVAAQSGGDVKGAVSRLIQDQVSLTGSSGKLVDEKNFMDKYLKDAKVSTKSVDQAFIDLSKEPGVGKWSDNGSLGKMSDFLNKQEVAALQAHRGQDTPSSPSASSTNEPTSTYNTPSSPSASSGNASTFTTTNPKPG